MLLLLNTDFTPLILVLSSYSEGPMDESLVLEVTADMTTSSKAVADHATVDTFVLMTWHD